MNKRTREEIDRLERTVRFMQTEVAIMRDRLDGMQERVQEPDALRRIADRHRNGTLDGHVLTAETFGNLVERFLDVEEIVKGDNYA